MMIACQMFDDYKEEILASFPPDLSEIEVKRRLLERLYGDEVNIEGFVESLRTRQKRIEAEQTSVSEDNNPSE